MDTAITVEIDFQFDNDERIICMHSNRHIQPSILRAMHDGDDDRLFDVTLYGAPAAGVAAANLRPIRAHKSVLAFAAKHLYDLLTSDGYTDSHQPEYRIEAVDHESLRHIVTFIYTDEIKVKPENAVDIFCGVLVGADYLVIKSLVVACEKFLAGDQQVTAKNCVKLWCLARKLSCFTLMHATSTFMAKHLGDMPKYAEFLSMPCDDFTKLVLSEALVKTSADLRCLAAIAWLEYDSIGRAPFVSDVVGMVPLTAGSVSLDTIHQAHECEMLREHAPKTLLKLVGGTVKKMKLMHTVPVACRADSWKNCWYVMAGARSSRQFFKYDVSRGLWSRLAPLPWRRCSFGACSAGHCLMAVSGWKEDGDDTVEIDEYDLLTETWSTVSSRATPPNWTQNVTALSDGQQVYMCDFYQNYIDVYNCASRNFTRIADVAGDWGAAAIKLYDNFNENCIYFAGRSDIRGKSRTIKKYEISNNKWSTVGALLAERRISFAATLAGDDLYLMGGRVDGKHVNTAEIFNIRTGQSRTLPNLLEACGDFRATTVFNDNVVCALGGCSVVSGCMLKTVEAYDTREGKWSTGVIIPDMPARASDFGFAAV